MPAALRGAALLGLWLVLTGSLAPADLAMGVVAAALGAWASLVLAPPRPGPAMRPMALAVLLLALPWQVLRAGVDVALRALAPVPRIRPGLLPFAPALPPGPTRDGFLALSALLPGTVPAGEASGGAVAIHALDIAAPVGADLAREEARFARALGRDG